MALCREGFGLFGRGNTWNTRFHGNGTPAIRPGMIVRGGRHARCMWIRFREVSLELKITLGGQGKGRAPISPDFSDEDDYSGDNRGSMDYRGMMREALGFIETNLKEDIHPEDVSTRVFFSLPHLYRIFRATLGCSIKEYIRRRRLSIAAEALLSTKAKVIDIALDLRYKSPETFLRAFKAEYGLAPLAFRKKESMAPLFPAAEFRERDDRGKSEGPEPRIVFHKETPIACATLRTSLAGGRNFREIPAFWDSLARGNFLRSERVGEPIFGLYTDWAGEDDFTLAVGRAAHVGANFSVPASSYAVFPLEPFDDSMIVGLWNYIYGEWFPKTGRERAGRLVDFERYTKNFSVYEIFVPLPE